MLIIIKMNFLKKRSLRRAKNYSNFLRNVIETKSKIIDVGLGDGTVAKQIGKDFNSKVIGIDVVDYNTTDIPLYIYDGKNINFKENSFDIALIIQVLHHCEDPIPVLKEAKRITKNKIIILEDVCTSFIHKIIACAYDFIMNIRHPVKTPFNFKREEEWTEIFKELNLKILEMKKYPYKEFYSPMKPILFVLKK